jgi:hypothetical protein
MGEIGVEEVRVLRIGLGFLLVHVVVGVVGGVERVRGGRVAGVR